MLQQGRSCDCRNTSTANCHYIYSTACNWYGFRRIFGCYCFYYACCSTYALFLHVFQVLLLIPLQALHQRCFPVIHYISSGSHYSLPYAFQQSCSLPHCRLCHNKGAVSPARFHILYYSYLINPFFYFQSGPMISYSGPVLSFSKYRSRIKRYFS